MADKCLCFHSAPVCPNARREMTPTKLPDGVCSIGSSTMEDNLEGDTSSVDIATNENMKALEDIGRKLLSEKVSRVDLETGIFQEVEGEGTNSEALTRFASLLSEERKRRRNK